MEEDVLGQQQAIVSSFLAIYSVLACVVLELQYQGSLEYVGRGGACEKQCAI